MSFLNTLRDYARNRSAGRRRLAAYLYVAELPTNIRKDIGWPDGEGFGEDVRLRRLQMSARRHH